MTTNKELEKLVNELTSRVESLEAKKVAVKSIHRLEAHSKDVQPEPRKETILKMNFEEQVRSMKNAIKILPPNMVDEEGRHKSKNISAICGFAVTDEMMELAYEGV